MSATSRVVALIDMDCFYCQVEAREDHSLRGVPSAVVQYNAWKGGGIIAVNYEARKFGVTRNMRGDDAKEKCPDIVLVSVPEVREKADLTKYRDAGKEVIQVLTQFKGCSVERASVDEAYIDITDLVGERMEARGTRVRPEDVPNTHVVGTEEKSDWLELISGENRTDDIRLSIGAAVVEEMRKAVFDQTEFRCSAGIAHNKTLAKMACGLHKPNKQTILPQNAVSDLFRTTKVGKMRGLGGKLGAAIVEELNCETLGDLAELSLARLRDRFDEKTSHWLFNIAQGVESEPVKDRGLPKSIGCSKNFPGPKALDTREKVEFWFSQLAEEVCERLEKDKEANGRVARGVTAHVRTENGGGGSKAGALNGYDAEKMTRQAMALVGVLNESTDQVMWKPKVVNLSIAATKFEEEDAQAGNIKNFFTMAKKKPQQQQEEEEGQSADKESEESEKEEDNEELVSVEELVPTLEGYDESILELLPSKIRTEVSKRVERLRNEAAGEGTSSSSNVAAEERVGCEKCGKMVSPFELPEHLDFHMARELQVELSREVARAAPVAAAARTSSTPTKAGKRKKNRIHVDSRGSKKQRNIASFFKKV